MNFSLDELDLLFGHADKYASKTSTDDETKVGAIAVSKKELDLLRKTKLLPDSILCSANTFTEGAHDIGLPRVRPGKHDYIVHAETNLVFKAARKGVPLEGNIVLCTLSPCHNCLRSLWQSGVREVYFRDIYKNYNGHMDDILIHEEKLGDYTRLILSPRG